MTDIPKEWIEACARAICEFDCQRTHFSQKPCVKADQSNDSCRAPINQLALFPAWPQAMRAITALRPLIEAETRERCAQNAVNYQRENKANGLSEYEQGWHDAASTIVSAMRTQGE